MLNVALVGNPNVGKTTVFNALTGSNQYVGNWPGVTVDKKEGFISKNIKVVDLPGIYAMDTFSNEEIIAKDFIKDEDVDLILNVVDASNLSRNLYLTTQLMEFNKPIVILLNMVDVAESKGLKINYDKLAKELGVKIIPIIGKTKKGIDKVASSLESYKKTSINYDFEFKDEKQTYDYIENILTKCINRDNESKVTLSEKIDKVILNPILAYPIFILALLLLFKFTFDWFGGPIQEWLGEFIDGTITEPITNLLHSSSPWFKSLIVDGVLSSISGTLPFFPLIFSLFLGLSFLEDSGYMSRTSFLMDRIMRKLGLSGKAFIPLVMGFGCSSPAIMASRTLESEKDRKLTALIAPLISCSARLPIYALFASIFFPKSAALVMTSIYVLGIVVAMLVALVLKNTKFNNIEEPFVLELPEYKLPTLKGVFKNTWEKSKDFLVRVVTVMFAMSVVIWALSSFNMHGYSENINETFLAYLGNMLSPIFAPLGFGDWRAGVSIITGISAKEIVISTMNVLYGDLDKVLPTVFTGVSAYSFLVFSSLYTPCMAALATMRKEFGTKMMFISAFYQFVLAWVIAFFFKTVGGIIFHQSYTKGSFEFLAAIIILSIAVFIIYRKLTSKSSGCSGCSSCSSAASCNKINSQNTEQEVAN